MRFFLKRVTFASFVFFASSITSILTNQQNANAGTWGCIGAQSSCLIFWYRTVNGVTEVGVDEVADFRTMNFE